MPPRPFLYYNGNMSKKKIRLKCNICDKFYLKDRTEYTRNLKLNRNSFCSISCAAVYSGANNPRKGHVKSLISNNRHDEYSMFRWFLKRLKYRKYECNIDLKYLKELWEKQQGKCPYTGWNLKCMRTTSSKDQLPMTPDRASLDRIDSDKGYIKGNVEFISYMAQCCKSIFSKDQVIQFCDTVTNYNKLRVVD